jgi:transcriptional regulator with XRE-family HTH domain
VKERIENLRKRLGFPRDPDLARKIGISARTLYYARNEGRASAKTRFMVEQAERAAGLPVSIPTAEEAVRMVQEATAEDLEFWSSENVRYRVNSILGDLANAGDALAASARAMIALLAQLQKSKAAQGDKDG